MERERLFLAISLALFGTIFIVPAWMIKTEDNTWGIIRILLLFLGGVMLFYAAVITFEELSERIGSMALSFHERARRAAAITPETEKLRMIHAMTAEQMKFLLQQGAAIVAVPGVAGAIPYYDLDGKKVPADFVTEFLELCDDSYLVPVRNWNDSISRDYAIDITSFCVNHGIARQAVGNQPARWRIPFDEAAGWFSLVM